MEEGERTIDELIAEFHALMGEAIAGWAKIEAHLFKICRAALGTSSRRAAIVFSRVGQLEAKRQLVDALLKTRLPTSSENEGLEHPDTQRWGGVSKDLRELIHIRNMIAHQPIEPHLDWTVDLDGGVGKTELWYEITASDHQRARDSKPGNSLNVDDLRVHIQNVRQLRERLAQFYADTLPKHAQLFP